MDAESSGSSPTHVHVLLGSLERPFDTLVFGQQVWSTLGGYGYELVVVYILCLDG